MAVKNRSFTKTNLELLPGLYHFAREDKDGKSRIHLRVDPDGSGILMVNASRVVQLNPTAAQMAALVLNEIPTSKAVTFFTKHFKVNKNQAKADYDLISFQIHEIIKEDGACPVCELALDKNLPFSARPSAPYRMDLAITYRCNNRKRTKKKFRKEID